MSRRRLLAPVLAALVTIAAVFATSAPAGAVGVPKLPRVFGAAIETYAPYHGQWRCAPYIRPGTKKLADLLVHTYPGTTYGLVRPCGKIGAHTPTVSEHFDGRAIDWMVNVRNPAQKAMGDALVAWLLADDALHHHQAMLRRLGIMYIIWNNRMWGTWNGQWEMYNHCGIHPSAAYDNACHRTHVHISLSWPGAEALTSFWTGKVATYPTG